MYFSVVYSHFLRCVTIVAVACCTLLPTNHTSHHITQSLSPGSSSSSSNVVRVNSGTAAGQTKSSNAVNLDVMIKSVTVQTEVRSQSE